MQRQLSPLPMWMTLVALGAAGSLVLLLAFTLRRESTFDDANTRVYESSLLPDDWSTYGADVWSVGYPDDWSIARNGDAVVFAPEDADDGDYLYVEKAPDTLETYENAYSEVAGMTRSEFRFAGYPAVKYSTYRRDVYFISYNEDLYIVSTDHPKDNEIGIMLATFEFIE